jgi:hypothetical protein
MRLRRALPLFAASVLLTPLAALAGDDAAPTLPVEAGVAAPLAEGTGTNLKPVAHIAYKGGTDLEFATIPDDEGNDREYAVAPSEAGYGQPAGLRLIDITDPTAPVVTGFLPCDVSQNDVQVFGTTVFMGVDYDDKPAECFDQAGAAPTTGLLAIDIADPTKPTAVGFVPVALGVHNSTLHPSGEYVYVSDSELTPVTSEPAGRQLGRINVIDVRDLSNMTEVFTLPLPTGLSSHDVDFNEAGTRAYSAAITQTLILDTTDPAEPSILTTILDPAINISHGADLSPDETHLYVTDEQAGAAANGVCNVGGVHVYDLTVEAAPVKTGYYAFNPANSLTSTLNSNNLTCTAHVLDWGPDGSTFSNAGYAAGVRIVDATERLAVPTELASFTPLDADTWSAKQHKDPRYLFSNDMSRGLDVYEYDPTLGAVDTRTAFQQRMGIHRVGLSSLLDGAWCANPAGTDALTDAVQMARHHAL